MRVLAAIAIGLALSVPCAWAGDFEDGVRYYKNKEYEKAITSWQKAAAQGNAAAQFTLGFVFEKGQG